MKATELISRLAKLIEEHGDLEVLSYTPRSEPECASEVKSISFTQDYVQPVFEIYGE